MVNFFRTAEPTEDRIYNLIYNNVFMIKTKNKTEASNYLIKPEHKVKLMNIMKGKQFSRKEFLRNL